jgi:hypothetical protein
MGTFNIKPRLCRCRAKSRAWLAGFDFATLPSCCNMIFSFPKTATSPAPLACWMAASADRAWARVRSYTGRPLSRGQCKE